MGADDVVVLNEGLEMRTAKSGRVRATIKVTSEGLVHDFTPYELGREPTGAIAEFFRRQVEDITAIAAPATLKARAVAARAVAKGKAWAFARYAGGRIGEMDPNKSDRLFNDSGRFAASIVANRGSEDSWRVNVASNRLDPNTADRGGVAAVEAIFAKLVDLVPAFQDSSRLGDDLGIVRAIKETQRKLVRIAKASSTDSAIEAVKVTVENAMRLYETIDEIASG